MPTIENTLRRNGWTKGAGPNFYFPNNHPHVHLGVDNAARPVANLTDIRSHIQFISLSWGGGPNTPRTVNLYSKNTGNENLGTGSYSVTKKAQFEKALYDSIGTDDAAGMQRMLNELTQTGIDS